MSSELAKAINSRVKSATETRWLGMGLVVDVGDAAADVSIDGQVMTGLRVIGEVEIGQAALVGMVRGIASVQYVVIGGVSGGSTVTGAAHVNVKSYGALGDGSSNDTAAIQAAIDSLGGLGGEIYFPPGTYKVTSAIDLVGPIKIRGQDSSVTVIRNDTGSVFSVAGSFIEVSHLTASAAGGHVVTQSDAVGQGHWHDMMFVQDSDAYSVWNNATHMFIDMRFDHFYSQHTQTATVPTWNLVAVGGTINDNVWEYFRAQRSGNYHFWMEATDANAQYSNRWGNATWEVCTGGLIRLISVNNYVIDEGVNWDLDSGAGGVITLQRHGIYATANASSITCFGTIRQQSRLAGGLAAGIYDAVLPGAGLGPGTIVDACNTASSTDPWTIDLASNRASVRRSGWFTALNATLATVQDYTSFATASDGTVSTGTVAIGGDTNLYRAGPNILKTDDAFVSDVGYFGPTLRHTGDTGPYATLSTTAIVIANRTTASNVPLKVDAMAGQTGDLTQWRDSAGNLLVFIGSGGQLSTTHLQVYGNSGFYGTAPVAKPSVTGSRGGNAALASLLTALASQGLVTDSTTA